MKLPANWQTTVSMIGGVIMSALTFLSTVSYDQGPIALIIPVKYKPTVALVAGTAALALFVWNGIKQKDKNVTGGTTQQTASGAVADRGTQTLVDATLVATKASGESLTPQQAQVVAEIEKAPPKV